MDSMFDSATERLAVVRLQRVTRAKRRTRLLEHHDFSKFVDPASGSYYYVKKDDPAYTTWSVPFGDVPLQPLDATRAQTLRLERAGIAAKKSAARYERERLMEIVRHRHAEEQEQRKRLVAQREQDDFERLWGDAFKYAAESGELNMANKGTGTLHPKMFQFERLFGRKLTALRLVAHSLRELPPRIAASMSCLTVLTLSANKLTSLPENVCDLIQLRSLNVMRNELVALPNRLGDLSNLDDLHVATNRLEFLPITFGNLIKLERVVLDCNRLRRVPETLARLTCRSLSVNSNRLISLPRCLVEMAQLTSLSANDNLLKTLPNCLGESKTLLQLRCCGNELEEVPESLGRMKQLTHLWLDHNLRLSSLPWNFYQLGNLRELRMFGNHSMMFPTQEKLIQGASAVRDWFRRRQKRALFVRRHRIVLTMQDLMEQVAEQRPRVCGAAFFEADTSHEDERWFAVVPEHFWERVLPALQDAWDEGRARKGRVTSLPYEREEIERVLATYEDAEGHVRLKNVRTKFRRCACVDADGKRDVCVPPEAGWMCARTATLFKMHVVLQREKIEKDRASRERLSIEQAIEQARVAASRYANSEEGQDKFHRRALRQAELEMAERRQARWEQASDAKVRAADDQIRTKYQEWRVALSEQRAAHEKELYRLLHEELEPREELLEGYARELARKEIDAVVETISGNMPEDAALATLLVNEEDARAASAARIRGAGYRPAGFVRGLLRRVLNGEQNELSQELNVDLVNRYTANELRKAEKEIRREHATMRRIAANWAGLGLSDVFFGWKKYAKRELRRRARDEWASKRDELQATADAAAQLELAEWTLAKYEAFTDEWSDLPMWRHCETGGVVWEEPTLEMLLPPGGAALLERFPPDAADSRRARDAVLRDQALAVRARDDDLSAEDSEEDAASEDHAGSTTASEDEPARDADATILETPEGELVAACAPADEYDDDAQSEGESLESDDPDLLEWDAAEADLPTTQNLQQLVALANVQQTALADCGEDALALCDETDDAAARAVHAERRSKESDAALERARMRRKIVFHPKRQEAAPLGLVDQALELARGALAAVAPADPAEHPTESEVMDAVGFDPNKEYTKAEYTALARKAHKLNKKLGVPESMDGAFEHTPAEVGVRKVRSIKKRLYAPKS